MPPVFPQHIRAEVLDFRNHLSSLPLRGYHPLWHAFSDDFGSEGEGVRGSHISTHFCADSVRPVPLSLAVTNGIALLSPPPLIKMLHFSGFPFSEENAGRSRREVTLSNPRF